MTFRQSPIHIRRLNWNRWFLCALTVMIFSVPLGSTAQTPSRPVCVAVLDFGDSDTGRLAAEKFASNLKREFSLSIMDRDQAMAAARSSAHWASLNLSRSEARDLGAALGCDFYVLGDAQTLRRSPSTGPIYFESYASIFLVSSRTGRLINWERPNFRADNAPAAEKLLLSGLMEADTRYRYLIATRRAQEDEQVERQLTSDGGTPVIQAAPDDEKLAEIDGLRLPRPYRRLTPVYPETAADAGAEATVDVLVDLDAKGEVKRVEVDRWAGFGLDQSTIETVRQLHFFPAMRNGVAVPIRILLRYNFRKPPR